MVVILVTGLLLQVKKQVPWVQPPEQRGTGSSPSLPLESVLRACPVLPGAEVRSWHDIPRLVLRHPPGGLTVPAPYN